jgi:cytochrome c peroxidase
MTRGKPIKLIVVVAVIVLAGLGVAALSADRKADTPVVADMAHGNVKFATGEMKRILNAVDAATLQNSPDELAAKGRAIFRNTALFQDGESCQTCHAEGGASDKLGQMVHDTQADQSLKPAAPNNFDGPRDPPSLWGLDKTEPYFWNGDVPTLQAAIVRPVKGHMQKFVTGTCSTATGDALAACDKEAGDLAAQLVAYVKTLDPPTTSFDEGRMSAAAKAGEKLFQGKGGCIECHGGPLFTDNLIHNTGVPQVNFDSPYTPAVDPNEVPCRTNPSTPGNPTRCAKPDLGAPPPPLPAECNVPTPPAGCEPDARQVGSAFINTPQLRDAKNTAPYMHNGSMKTLRDVVNFYNNNSAVSPLNLTPAEVDELVAYLQAL